MKPELDPRGGADQIDTIDGQDCPFCHQKTLTLFESEREIPYFGRVYLFSMSCVSCKYHKADVEPVEQREAARYSIEVTCEDDMNVRVVRSSAATIKIPHVTTITPGPASNGYVTNIEGILSRVKHQVETLRDDEEDPTAKHKAKNLAKKLQRVMWGQERLKIIIEDPTGNSAIVSEKALVQKL